MLASYITSNNKTHIIFDLDKTIVWVQLPWEEYLDDMEEALKKIDSGIIDNYRSGKLGWAEMQNEYIATYSNIAKDIIIANNTKFEEKVLGIKKHNDIISFIEKAEGYTFYIWSSNTLPTIQHVLSLLKIGHKFSAIASRTNLSLLKPHPEGFEMLYDIGISKEKYLMVGDSMYDQNAAENAGIDFFKVDFF